MRRYTIFFIAVNALHVSGHFSAHNQELKTVTQHLVYVKLAAATTSVGAFQRIASCWLYLKEYINDAQYNECQVH